MFLSNILSLQKHMECKIISKSFFYLEKYCIFAPTKNKVIFVLDDLQSGRSVVRSSRLVWDQEVAGSNPAAPTVLVIFSKLQMGV